eukprot:NODE_9646_length_467_cov_2.755981_g8556_i0.p3 GENE.NODE_9646_length_467_cov_2.755981_g8556_i0~~NODE_9646_length_467_cov_2.755981_g8556_i0.p3  ORF type:complete len:71 (+),score=5.47 NODE_9646_length_467_cov_2.755981_g8556_i0:84-296(+)
MNFRALRAQSWAFGPPPQELRSWGQLELPFSGPLGRDASYARVARDGAPATKLREALRRCFAPASCEAVF